MRSKFSGEVIRRALLVFGAVNLLISGVFWVWNPPPRIGLATRTRNAAPDVQSAHSRTEPADSSEIIRANIFSSSRTPPDKRYNPTDDQFDNPVDASPPVVPQEVSPPPQLFGTVLGPGGAMALMQSDSSAGPGRLYREGDRIGVYRLLKVKANSVIVVGPSGRLEIHVQRSPTSP